MLIRGGILIAHDFLGVGFYVLIDLLNSTKQVFLIVLHILGGTNLNLALF